MRFASKKGWRLGWVALALVCLGGTEQARADEAKPVTVTEKKNEGKVTLTKGQELVVRLDITTGTGFTWVVAKKDDKQLEQTGKPAIERDKEAKPGAKARQVFRFKGLKAGTSTLELEYKRPFEKKVKPAKTFKVTVTVKDQK